MSHHNNQSVNAMFNGAKHVTSYSPSEYALVHRKYILAEVTSFIPLAMLGVTLWFIPQVGLGAVLVAVAIVPVLYFIVKRSEDVVYRYFRLKDLHERALRPYKWVETFLSGTQFIEHSARDLPFSFAVDINDVTMGEPQYTLSITGLGLSHPSTLMFLIDATGYGTVRDNVDLTHLMSALERLLYESATDAQSIDLIRCELEGLWMHRKFADYAEQPWDLNGD